MVLDSRGKELNFDPDIHTRAGYITAMSLTEIINELPKLTEMERRMVRAKLLALALKDEGANLCNQAAIEGALMLDEMEETDARREQGAKLNG